ncbi:unnamed protein product [Spirodela intermedia]|uniref:Uncharacterized protein n=1 Tax=Spirodela intermedia TaxID=51605 RepID=A0A7I8JHM8_SPIIN|nr:unnamed protein product [Spirodela intermedia]CAA6669053.1 unnamed protein product [Spirodela intermedia]
MEPPGCGLALTKGGEAETSYARNSSLQKPSSSSSSINSDKLSVADLGCSSGPNALSVIANIVDGVEEGCRRLGRPPPEVLVFLNDLPGNDFNAIFLSLQGFYERREAVRPAEGLCRCFVAGIAGSFHGRLFPSRSIHLFHSSSSFTGSHRFIRFVGDDNFRSIKDPSREGMVLNKGNIYISEESLPSVVEAYKRQFQSNFSSFLRSRSVETVVGGRMVLNLGVRTSLDPAQADIVRLFNRLSRVLKDLVKEVRLSNFIHVHIVKLKLVKCAFVYSCLTFIQYSSV